MAKLPPIKRIVKEDLQDAPAWISRLLDPINSFMESVYSALDRDLVVGENISGETKLFTIKAGALATDNTFTFTTTSRRTPKHVIPSRVERSESVYTPITAAVSIDWRFDAGQIIISSIVGLTNGETYNITLLVL